MPRRDDDDRPQVDETDGAGEPRPDPDEGVQAALDALLGALQDRAADLAPSSEPDDAEERQFALAFQPPPGMGPQRPRPRATHEAEEDAAQLHARILAIERAAGRVARTRERLERATLSASPRPAATRQDPDDPVRWSGARVILAVAPVDTGWRNREVLVTPHAQGLAAVFTAVRDVGLLGPAPHRYAFYEGLIQTLRAALAANADAGLLELQRLVVDAAEAKVHELRREARRLQQRLLRAGVQWPPGEPHDRPDRPWPRPRATYLWLCAEGWRRFGPFEWLAHDDERRAFVDQHGQVVARWDEAERQWVTLTPEGLPGPGGHTPMITLGGEHPNPNCGAPPYRR